MSEVLFDDHAENVVISFLLKDLQFIDKALPKLSDKTFYRKEFGNLFGAIRRAYEKYKCLLTKKMFEGMLKDSLQKAVMNRRMSENEYKERTELYLNLFDKLSTMEGLIETEFSFYVDRIKDLQIKRSLFDLSKVIVQNLKEGRESSEILKLAEVGLNKTKYETKEVTVVKRYVWESIEERWKSYQERKTTPEKFVGIMFGLPQVDMLTNGMQSGELGMVFARTGRGKSRFLFNYGYNASCKGFHVLYATLEMYIEQVERMYDSRQARISYTRLKKGQLLKEEEEAYKLVLDTQKRNKNHFFTVDIPRGCTVSILESELDQYERAVGHKIDLLIVDYLTLMKSEDKFAAVTDKLGHITRELKELARLKKMVVFTANQANRSAMDAIQIGTEHISLSDQIAPHCDFVAYLEQDSKDKMKNILKNHVVKYRDGANTTVEHQVNWDLNYIGDRVLQIKGN